MSIFPLFVSLMSKENPWNPIDGKYKMLILSHHLCGYSEIVCFLIPSLSKLTIFLGNLTIFSIKEKFLQNCLQESYPDNLFIKRYIKYIIVCIAIKAKFYTMADLRIKIYHIQICNTMKAIDWPCFSCIVFNTYMSSCMKFVLKVCYTFWIFYLYFIYLTSIVLSHFLNSAI